MPNFDEESEEEDEKAVGVEIVEEEPQSINKKRTIQEFEEE